MFEFFHYNYKKDELVFNVETITTIQPFKKLWNRNKNKENSKKEFLFVFYVANWTSKNPYANLPLEEKIKEAKSSANLSKEWEPDALVEECINYYISETIRVTPTAKALYEIQQVLMQSAQMIEIIRTQMS